MKSIIKKEWKDISAIYQIYPRSFVDSNGDGIGDLRGVISRLDYLSNVLGVEAIWLSPFYPSPQEDHGYDISNYKDVDRIFGSMDDFKELLEKSHELGLKVMIDFVPNHTSNQHEWFKESRSSRNNPKREYYVWRDPKPDGSEPNNWLSLAGGRSWTFDEATGQYYLHSFMSSQPDLNWENEVVREEMKNILRFWFDMGVDGFRVDAVWVLSKNPDLVDDPVNESFDGDESQYGFFKHSNCKEGPRLLEYLHEIASTADEYNDRFIVFEYYPDTTLGDPHQQIQRLNSVAPGRVAPFYFEGLHLPWRADTFGATFEHYIKNLPRGSFPLFCFGNHDQSRIANRFGEKQSRLLAILQMTLPGVPTIYYGEEIGMEDLSLTEFEAKDVFDGEKGGMGGRDPERTPMQWSSQKGAGFTTSNVPWLPINDNFMRINVARQFNQKSSMLSLYRSLLKIRQQDCIKFGDFKIIDVKNGYVLAFGRSFKGEKYLVFLNFADQQQAVRVDEPVEFVLSSYSKEYSVNEDNTFVIDGYDGAVFKLVGKA